MKGLSSAGRQLLQGVQRLLPSEHQRATVEALLGLFLQATGNALLPHSRLTSSRE